MVGVEEGDSMNLQICRKVTVPESSQKLIPVYYIKPKS